MTNTMMSAREIALMLIWALVASGIIALVLSLIPRLHPDRKGFVQPLRVLLFELWTTCMVRDPIGVVADNTPVGPMNVQWPFVVRTKEAAQLRKLRTQRKHVLLLGPAGVGKTASVRKWRQAEWREAESRGTIGLISQPHGRAARLDLITSRGLTQRTGEP